MTQLHMQSPCDRVAVQVRLQHRTLFVNNP